MGIPPVDAPPPHPNRGGGGGGEATKNNFVFTSERRKKTLKFVACAEDDIIKIKKSFVALLRSTNINNNNKNIDCHIVIDEIIPKISSILTLRRGKK